MPTVTINHEPRPLPDFSAFKAVTAMEIVGDVETSVRELVHQAGDFKAEYAKRHTMNIGRAEARRQFGPQPLIVQRTTEDGVEFVPVVEDGVPVLGPDPLGHLTDADWQASGNVLTIPEQPSEDAVMLAMIPRAFKLARTSVLRLLALALASDRDVEEWDMSGEVETQLDTRGRKLLHECRADELLKLTVAVLELAREQVAGPFAEARSAVAAIFRTEEETPDDDETPTAPEREPEPMRIETESDAATPDSPTSSTGSPDATAGSPTPSSTAPAGVSS